MRPLTFTVQLHIDKCAREAYNESMKFSVIGWTSYEDEKFPAHCEDYDAVDGAVAEAIRAGGFRFGGDTHQNGDTCTPVLSDGTRAQFSFREWGYVMAEALSLYDESGPDYMAWYMDIERTLLGGEKLVLPPAGVDESRIRPREELAETFPFSVSPAAFDAVASGKKTVEFCARENGLERVCRDDFLLYECGEKRCRVRVTSVEHFPSFAALFGGEDDGEELRRRKNLVRRALYEGCDAPALRCELAEKYPNGEKELYSVAAFTFARADEEEA